MDLEWAPDAGTGFADFDHLTDLVITMTGAMRAGVVDADVDASAGWMLVFAAATVAVTSAIVVLLVWSRIRHSRLEAEFSAAVDRDDLTGLNGRSHLEATLGEERRRDGGALIGVLYLDLDGFKAVNDSQGHHVGDRVLCGVAERLIAVCREQDVPARIGGDEFVVMLIGVSGVDEVLTIGERFVAAITQPFNVDGREVTIGVSIGAALSRTEDDLGLMLRDADTAMYAAKQVGRGQVVVAS